MSSISPTSITISPLPTSTLLSKINPDFTFKLVLVGDSSVGKSNLLYRFTKNEFFTNMKTTIGVEFASRLIDINKRKIKVQIWDTSGQERYRGAVGALLIYDITKPKTFLSLAKWLEEMSNYADPSTIIGLIGNKSDLDLYRKITYQEGLDFANKYNIPFIETSAKDCNNVNEAFMKIIMDSYKMIVSKGLLKDDAIAPSDKINKTNKLNDSSLNLIDDEPKINESSSCCK